jgi:hypothetical protein
MGYTRFYDHFTALISRNITDYSMQLRPPWMEFFMCFLESAGTATIKTDFGSLLQAFYGQGFTDALRRAGDQYYFIFDVHFSGVQ